MDGKISPGKGHGPHQVSGMLGFLLTAALTCLLTAQLAWSSVTGSISGTVKDTSGGVVASASVTALNTGTGVGQSVQTDAVGFYVFPVLPVGVYEITIRHTGFKDYRQTALTLDANRRAACRCDTADRRGGTGNHGAQLRCTC